MSDGRPMHLFLVESDTAVRESLADLLVEEGFAVSTAKHGADAIRRLTSAPRPPDLVLVELAMPIAGGDDVLRAMRGDARLATVPVLMLSASTRRGPDGVARLAKPFAGRELVAAIRSGLGDVDV
jgi:DNA-binding response OmpR family regulator